MGFEGFKGLLEMLERKPWVIVPYSYNPFIASIEKLFKSICESFTESLANLMLLIEMMYGNTNLTCNSKRMITKCF